MEAECRCRWHYEVAVDLGGFFLSRYEWLLRGIAVEVRSERGRGKGVEVEDTSSCPLHGSLQMGLTGFGKFRRGF